MRDEYVGSEIKFVTNSTFGLVRPNSKKEREILADIVQEYDQPKIPPNLPPYLADMYRVPLLEKDQERHLFRKMNYLRFKAVKLRRKAAITQPGGICHRLLCRSKELLKEAENVRSKIVTANLRLVISIVKKRCRTVDDLFPFISEGNLSVMRAADLFDYGRGFRFSTYATWAIIQNLQRTFVNIARDRLRSTDEAKLEDISDGHIDEAETAHAIAVNKEVVTRILDKLPERERLIVELRFGLNGREQHTLKRAGEVIGVTKERIRQLEQRAYRLMRREIAASGITSDTGEELDRRLLEC